MYPVDEKDTVVEIHEAPQPDPGAPLPVVLASEGKLLLAYLFLNDALASDQTYPRPISAISQDVQVATVRFRHPYAHIFGPPNDEAFSGHPLSTRGLAPYAVWEIQRSSWIRQLERMNSVHPQHDHERFMANKKHFVFAFHDSMFECIAHGFDVQIQRGSLSSAIVSMIKLFEEN